MKLRTFVSVVSFILLLAVSLELDAQRSVYKSRRAKSKSISRYKGGHAGGKFRPYHYASFNVNALNYFGDLAPVNKAASTDVSFTRPGFGGELGYRFSPFFATRLAFNYGRIKGDDISSDPADEESYGRYLRNLSFRNDIKELSIGFEVYLNPHRGGPNSRPEINVYLFAGLAVFHHEPKGKVPDFDYTTGSTEKLSKAGQWVKLRPLGTEGQFDYEKYVESKTNIDFDLRLRTYSPFQVSVPLAIGAKFRLPGPFDAGVEFGYRLLFTDYIDDVSGYYMGHDVFQNDLARIMADRSAEPTAYWADIERLDVRVVGMQMSGTTYYSAGDVGGGLAGFTENLNNVPATRGNPKDNDMIFVTTLKLSYILGQKRTSGKFR